MFDIANILYNEQYLIVSIIITCTAHIQYVTCGMLPVVYYLWHVTCGMLPVVCYLYCVYLQVAARLTAPIVTTYVNTDKIEFERAKAGVWGFRTDKCETVNGYECKVS